MGSGGGMLRMATPFPKQLPLWHPSGGEAAILSSLSGMSQSLILVLQTWLLLPGSLSAHDQ